LPEGLLVQLALRVVDEPLRQTVKIDECDVATLFLRPAGMRGTPVAERIPACAGAAKFV
jgi:hypothetical protein